MQMGKSRDPLILMVGKLVEQGGGHGLLVSPNDVMARYRADYLCDRLHKHEIPFTFNRMDMVVEIECLGVTIRCWSLQRLENRVQGLELQELVDESTAVRKLTEREWYTMNTVRCRVRERR